MKQIEVVAAIIRKDDKIFATQRGYGEWKDWWEFPGGKMESEETPEEALKREIREELATDIGVDDLIETIEWDYPKFHLTMHCYWCHVKKGSLSLQEHEAAKSTVGTGLCLSQCTKDDGRNKMQKRTIEQLSKTRIMVHGSRFMVNC